MKQYYDASVIYCNEKRQPEPLLVEPQECESVKEFIDFLLAFLESVKVDDTEAIEKVIHSISAHSYTIEDVFTEDDKTYVDIHVFVA